MTFSQWLTLCLTYTWDYTATQLPNPCPGTGLDWLGMTSKKGQSEVRCYRVSLGGSHKDAALGTSSQQRTSIGSQRRASLLSALHT